MKSLKSNKYWVDLFENTYTEYEDLLVLEEFLQEGETEEEEVKEQHDKLLKSLEDLELKSTLNAPEDELNAILTINAGAGGTESCDWAAMLMRMYVMWGEKSGFKVRELDVKMLSLIHISEPTRR